MTTHPAPAQESDIGPICAVCHRPLDTSKESHDGPGICAVCDGYVTKSGDTRPDGPFQSGTGFGGEQA